MVSENEGAAMTSRERLKNGRHASTQAVLKQVHIGTVLTGEGGERGGGFAQHYEAWD